MNYDPYELGLEVWGHSGAEYHVLCPVHGDSHPSASFNAEKGLFVCYACGAKGTALQVADWTGGNAVAMVDVPQREIAEAKEIDWVQWGRSPRALDNEYLASRRVTNEQVLKWDIRQNHDGVLFPLKNNTGKLVGYQMRKYKGKPKYVFYGDKPDFWPYENLATNDPLYIVEGVFSVMRLDRVGLKAIAIFGTGNAKRVARLLRHKDAYALFDTDDAGLIAMAHFIRSGQPGIPAILLPRSFPEPDELNPKQMAVLQDFRTSSVSALIKRADDWRKVRDQIRKE